MPAPALQMAIAASADPVRVKHYVDQLQRAGAAFRKLAAEPARVLAALLAGSPASVEALLARPDWLPALLDPGALDHPRQDQGLRREVNHSLAQSIGRGEYDAALDALREFKRREMIRIAARDLARLGDAAQITREISNVADVCLNGVCQVCQRRLAERHGEPFHLDADGRWRRTLFCVLGMGKLGGQELNYSSDVDVIFVYSDEGRVFKTPPGRAAPTGQGTPSHSFFVRLSEAIVAEVARQTAAGSLFRIDLRLRPEGPAGPLARSLPSYENYYAQWGQTWERMALMKARPVGGDLELGAEFIEAIHAFRYPRSLNNGVLREIAVMKTRLENEIVKPGELDRNVKLGRGGIREIEFIAQALQLMGAGAQPFLQSASTLGALKKLAHYSLLSAQDAADLAAAYVFFRDVEHRLQMEAYRQTHTIPAESHARARLARLMGFAAPTRFEAARAGHAANVRRIYGKILPDDEQAPEIPPPEVEGREEEWKKELTARGFRDAGQAFKMAAQFLHGPGYVHVSSRTTELAHELWRRLLEHCPGHAAAEPSAAVLADPDGVIVRLNRFIDAYGARATLYEMWARQPALFDVLLLLFDRSEFLAERAIRTPDLVDELESGGRLRRANNADETLRDLRHGAADEDQVLWMRRYHEAELMRIGLRDILGLADLDRNWAELSALADACLQYALEILFRKHGFKSAPFAVIGLGKLGGREINYGSDLDVIFVADAPAKALPPLQRLAAEFIDLLSARTAFGSVFDIDARLRPDGEKGLLVNNLEAHEEYYRRRADLWEIQSLTRVRPIAGDAGAGERFRALAAALTNFSGGCPPGGLRAYRAAWKKEINDMRGRIARERTPPGREEQAIKTARGGLMDAEFLAQALNLQTGAAEANTVLALKRAALAGAIPSADGAAVIDNYKNVRRIEAVLRRWSFSGEAVLPDDPVELGRLAVRCGYSDAHALRAAVRDCRAVLSKSYDKFFRRGR